MKIRHVLFGALSGALSFCVLGGAAAAPKPEAPTAQSFYGSLKYGTTDSSVGDLSFGTRSAQGSKIFDACKMGEFCHVKATVKPGRDTWIAKLVKAEKVPTNGKPCDLVGFIYSHITETTGFQVADEDRNQVFSERLVRLISTALKRPQNGPEDEVIIAPWFLEHEGWPRNLKIVTTMMGEDSAICRATLTNATDASDEVQKYNFEMSKTADGWRINDVRLPLKGPGTLVSYADNLDPPKK